MRRGSPDRNGLEATDAAEPPPDCNCGSLTGDSGGAGRRPRLKYFWPHGTSADTVLCADQHGDPPPGTDGNHPAARVFGRRAGAAVHVSTRHPALHAAGDRDDLAGDVAGDLVRGEDDHDRARRRRAGRPSSAASCASRARRLRVERAARHRRLRPARRDRVHPARGATRTISFFRLSSSPRGSPDFAAA